MPPTLAAARHRTRSPSARLAACVFLTFQAFVLGLVQGLTEFIPVSSSGHLQAVPFLFGWRAGSLEFDVAVHIGTLLAVLIAFRADLATMVRAAFGRRGTTEADILGGRRLLLLLAVASLPAAAFGLGLRSTVTAAFDQPLVVAFFLVVTAGLLWYSERRRTALGTSEATGVPSTAELGAIPLRTALAVGFAQALAIFPGVSRSGATIAAGLSSGLSRGMAARFSFLLSIPITAGAALLTLPGLADPPADALPFGTAQVLVGIVTSALSGYLAIRFLLALVARRDLLVFARYVLVLAAVIVGTVIVRG